MDRASMSSHRCKDGSHIYYAIDHETDSLVILPDKGKNIRASSRTENGTTTQVVIWSGEIPFMQLGKNYDG